MATGTGGEHPATGTGGGDRPPRTGGGHLAEADRHPRALAELLGLFLWFLPFSRLHEMAGRDVAAATANAATVRSIEDVLKPRHRARRQQVAGRPALSLAAMCAGWGRLVDRRRTATAVAAPTDVLGHPADGGD